jgi:hypothetical protein
MAFILTNCSQGGRLIQPLERAAGTVRRPIPVIVQDNPGDLARAPGKECV